MKTLYLVRHAKSSWKDTSLADINRPLNKRGKRDAPFMGELIHKKGISPDILVSSPAVRTQATAKAFAKALNYPETQILSNAAIYESSISGLLDVVKTLDSNWSSAMLFGHNFTYTDFVNLYATPPIDNLPTCGVAVIEFDVNTWSEITRKNGKLLLMECPRTYFPKNRI